MVEEEQTIEFKAKIKQISTSNFILVPMEIIKKLNLDAGKYVSIIISNTIVNNQYLCRLCSHQFVSDDDNPYCPCCDADGKDLKLIEIEAEND